MESIIFEALRLQTAGAWRSLRLLGSSASACNQPVESALLAALCRSPLEESDTQVAKRIAALTTIAPPAASALALTRDLYAIAQVHILNDDIEGATVALRQALASNLDAVAATGITPPTALREHLFLHADHLLRTLQAQLDLSMASRSGALPRQLALVLGMHRSGTSALTGMLAHAGLHAPRDLMPPTPRNPQGYWESLAVMQSNDRMLKQLGRTWATYRPLREDDWNGKEHAIHRWCAELLRHLRTNYPTQSRAILKDPRLCPLMPGLRSWLESDLINVVFLLPIRHPAEVAASLHTAEGTPVHEVLQLWLLHMFSAERNSRGFDRLIVGYQEMVEQPNVVLDRCVQFLQKADGSEQQPPTWNSKAADFINPNLRHHHRQASDAHPEWSRTGASKPWYQLAETVYSLMSKTDLCDSVRAERMDQLELEWESLLL